MKIGVAVSDSPTGPFVDSGAPLIASNPDGGQAIDPAVFTDDDGQSYLYWGNGNAYVAPLNADMVSIDVSKRKRLTGLTGFREGLFMHKRAGVYYLSWSIDDTRSENYRVGYATATSPMGDGLVNRGEILNKDPSLGILGTGHHSVIQIPDTDDWYIAYHRFGIPGGDGTHREVTIDRLYYNADGTIKRVVPTLEGVAPLPTKVEAPGGVGGTVPATLSLTLGPPASFGTFVPGVAREYTASTTANVVSTAGDAALTVSERGHLVNGSFALPEPLAVEIAPAAWTLPVSNAAVAIAFRQKVGATDPLRTGIYSRALTFTLSTTTP